MSEQMLTEDATISGESESSLETEASSNCGAAKHIGKKHKKNQNGPNDYVKLQELLVETSKRNDRQEQSTEVVNATEVGADACLEKSQSNTCSTPSLGKRKRMEQKKGGQDTLKRNGTEHDNLEILASTCLKLDENKNDEEPIFSENMSTGQQEKRHDVNGSTNADTWTINNCHDPQIGDAVPVPDVKAINSTCKQDVRSMPNISEQLFNPSNCVNFSSMNNLQEHVDDDNIVDEEISIRTYTSKRQKDSCSRENSVETNEQGANSLLPELTKLPIESRNTCLNCPDKALAPGWLVDDLKQEELAGHATSIIVGDDILSENLGVSSDLERASMENTNSLEDTAIGEGSATNVLGANLTGEKYEHAERSKKNANLIVPCEMDSIEKRMKSVEKASTDRSSHIHTLATLSQMLKSKLQDSVAFSPKTGPAQVNVAIGEGSVTNVAGEKYEPTERSKKNANLTVPCGMHSIEKRMKSVEKAFTDRSSYTHTLATLSQMLKSKLQDSVAFSPKTGPAQVNVAEPINPPSLEKLHSSCSRKKLLVLDVNGLLADIVVNENLSYQPDAIISTKAVFKRPFCDDFLKFCFERFNVGVWSSRTKKNVQRVLDFLIRRKGYNLLFCWDQSHCTETGYNTIENKDKPLVLKELKKLWEKQDPDLPWERGDYDESNTLLLDDSPYKALRNPPNTAIFPFTYEYWHKFDNALAAKGHLRMYLERLAEAENVQDFVEKHPFGQRPITKANVSWPFYLKIIGNTSSQLEAGDSSSLATKSQPEASNDGSLATKSQPEAGDDGSLAAKSHLEAGEDGSLAIKPQLEASDDGSLASKSQLKASDDGSLATKSEPETVDVDSLATKSQQRAGENGSLAIKPEPEAGDDGSLATKFQSEVDGNSCSATLEAGSLAPKSEPEAGDNSSSH